MAYCGVAGRFGWAHGIGPAGVHCRFNIWMEFYTFLQATYLFGLGSLYERVTLAFIRYLIVHYSFIS